MGDIIGKVQARSGKQYHVERSQHDVVQVKEITGLWASWQYVGKASSNQEALRMAEAFVFNK